MKITHQDFIGVYENTLSKDNCDRIILEIERQIQNNNAGLNSGEEVSEGKNQFGEMAKLGRQDYSVFPNITGPNWLVRLINTELNRCIGIYGEEFFPIKQLKIRSDEIKLQKTPPRGGYHVWHCEHAGRNMGHRILAWTLYLNDIPEGEGETEFLWQGLKVKPKAGTLSIFPAGFTHTHRGNPVYAHNKYIATGWFSFVQ